MIAAGYALYGSATVIVLSFGDAPSMFMLGLFYIINRLNPGGIAWVFHSENHFPYLVPRTLVRIWYSFK